MPFFEILHVNDPDKFFISILSHYNQEDILKNLIPKKPNFLPIYEVRKYLNIQFIDTFVCKTGTKVEIKILGKLN